MEDEESVQTVPIFVFTEFFNRDAQMYALGDIPLQKPKSIRAMVYTLILLVVWSIPLMLLITVPATFSNVITAAIVFGPALFFGPFMAKPNFHEKTLIRHVQAIIKYTGLATMYCDLEEMPYDEKITSRIKLWLAN